MSTNQNLTTMSKSELREYVLQHRDNEEALQVYLAKAQTENPSSHIYSPAESVSDAVARYLDKHQHQ